MFRKREKKIYPPDTFVETPLRVMAIIQLCLAFTLICWNLATPFMGEHFILQRKMKLVETVLGDAERFTRLPFEVQNELLRFNHFLHESSSFLGKIERAFWQLLVALPPFELAWIVFAIVIGVMVLKKRSGARQAAWLLPLLAMVHLCDNLYFGVERPLTAEARLYPSEQHLIGTYVSNPLSADIREQHRQLKEAWERYIVAEWVQEEPAIDKEKFNEQVRDGEYRFTVARVQALGHEKQYAIQKPLLIREPLFFLLAYLIWNGLFAYVATKPLLVQCKVSKESGYVA